MKLLHLEDHPRDASLVRDLLEPEWPDLDITVVTHREGFLSALTAHDYDVILSDFKLPGFNGWDALKLAREHRPDIPFIFLSGTVGEDAAVEIVRAGAADYLLKDRMQRLPLAIRRALKDRDELQQRRQAGERIREQAELLDKARDAIVVTDLAHLVRFWNQGAERIFGWSSHEVIGRKITEFFGAALRPTYAAMAERLAETDEWRGELTLGNKGNRPLLADVRVSVIRDADGQPKSQLNIITDITERKKLEAQFFHAQRMESLGMLAAGIAHDLNNALAPMLMAGELLRSRMTDPQDQQLLTMLGQSAERSAGLVRQILSFAGGRSDLRVLIQPKHLLREILDLMRDTFPKSIQLEHEIPNGLWTVRGNLVQIHQILLNLCINARDAMPQGGVLRLLARNQTLTDQTMTTVPEATPGSYVVLEVADNGTGIPPDVLAHIWEPFFTTKAEGKGTGLGLSTVRGIAANHGGFATVETAVGSGTTFRVFLPATTEPAAETRSTGSNDPLHAQGNGELILVVDDEASIRESVSAVLRQHGYRTLVIPDAIHALSQYVTRLREASLVISDLDMPGLNGIAFSQALFHLNPSVRILLTSGGADESTLHQITIMARVGFLAKPFTPETLLKKIRESLLN
jgi:two-component system, cell cycle sensor histidine kinase and response regulator CckA